MFSISIGNIILFILYPVSLLAISIYATRGKEITTDLFFYANRNLNWLVAGISLGVTCYFVPFLLSFTTQVSLFAAVLYSFISIMMLYILGWIVAPRFIQMKIITLPEYFERRFNRSNRFFLSALYIISNIIFRLLPALAIGGILLHKITGIDSYSILLFFLMVTGLYVIISGLKGELYTNLIHTFFILGSVCIVLLNGIVNENLLLEFHKNSIVTSLDSPTFEYILGFLVIGFWFWIADQFVVQKISAVNDKMYIKKTVMVSMVLQVILIVLYVIAGVLQSNTADTSSFNFSIYNFNHTIFSEMLKNAIAISAIAIIMMVVAATLNSVSLLISFDFYKNIRQEASGRELVLVARMSTILLLLISFLLMPISQALSIEKCLILWKIFVYIASMVAAVLFVSLISSKINSASAMVTFLIMTPLIFLRAIVELYYNNYYFDGNIVLWLAHLEFLEFSIFVFLFSIILLFTYYKLNSGFVNNIFSKKHKTVF